MSSTTYTMKLIVDDSAIRKLEERMGKLMGGGGGGSGGGGSGGGDSSNPFKNLMKLGVIAAGIAFIVVAVKKISEKIVEASPALQAMLKLLDASITLILRPFGDFVAYLLKPILIIFLTKIALPFYKLVQPLMQWLGTNIGEGIAGGIGAVGQMAGALFNGDVEGFLNGLNVFKGHWLRFVDWIADKLGLPPAVREILNKFWDFFESIIVQPWLIELVGKFFDFITHMKVPEWVTKMISAFFEFFLSLGVEKWAKGILSILFGFAGWFVNLIFDPRIKEMIDKFLIWFNNLDVPAIVSELVDMFFKFFDSIEIEDWMNIFVAAFFGFVGLLGIASSLIDPFMSFVKFILWISISIMKAAKWFADALSFIGLGGIFGGGGSDTASTSSAKTDININIEGSGELGQGQMEELLAKLNELMK